MSSESRPIETEGKSTKQSDAASAKSAGPVLSVYSDYRRYLGDFYEYRRQQTATSQRPFSYAHFAAAADIRSPNYLKLIIEGKRNLSDAMILRFARALKFNKDDTEEFTALVHYGQATQPADRIRFLRALSEIRSQRARDDGKISPEAWRRFPDWLSWVLFAMADQSQVEFETGLIQRLLRARVDASSIQSSLEKLTASGNFTRKPDGELVRSQASIEAPQDLPVELIRQLQVELIYLGIESLFRDSPRDREFGALTAAMTNEEFEQVRFELRQLRKRLQKEFMVRRESSKGDRVYQLNIQFFPVTEKV